MPFSFTAAGSSPFGPDGPKVLNVDVGPGAIDLTGMVADLESRRRPGGVR